MKTLAILLLLSLLFSSEIVSALKCYTCSTSEEDTDQTCVTDPENTSTGSPITTCNKKYCTSIRIEYKDPKNKVQSMFRGCEDDPLHMTEVIEDSTYRSYFVACTTDLCNGGTGKSSSTDTPTLGDKSTIYCPGIGNSGAVITEIHIFVIVIFIIQLII